MVKARTWFTLFIISLGTVAATASCGSDEATGASAGASGVGGGGIISGAGRAGATSRAGSGGGSSAGGSLLGGVCTSDAQCGDGLICAKTTGTTFGKGGPSNGVCTMACDPSGTSAECDALKPGAACLPFGTTDAPTGFCFEACELGDPLGDLDTKCGGRSDEICVDLSSSDTPLPFCIPHCRSDAECGGGLFCDKTSLLGLCSKTKPAGGDPVGTACTPGPDTDTCEGLCLRSSATGVMPITGVCVEPCSGGFECMYGPGSKSTPGGFCGGQLSDPFGPLDLGYCLPNCSCSSDCPFPGDLCRKWPDADSVLVDVLGAPGVCYPSVAMSVELSCGEGGAGGAGGDGAGGAGGDGTGTDTAGASGSN